MNEHDRFRFTYSAARQQEVERIRKKYLPQEEDKLSQLRRLDSLPGKKAKAWSLVLGILGSLIMGTGMSLAMTEIGAALGSLAMVIGIAVGIVGMVLVALAYPMYSYIINKERRRIAPQILQLTDELMK